MKIRIFALLLALLLLLAGCAKNEASQSAETPAPEVTEVAAEPTEEPTAEPTVAATEAPAAANAGFTTISAEEAKKMIDAGNVTIVDVRREDEYREQHIPGSVLVPNESIGTEAPAELPDKDAVLLVHCRSGVRSQEASAKLAALGYTQVYDFGGIIDWPYETVSE